MGLGRDPVVAFTLVALAGQRRDVPRTDTRLFSALMMTIGILSEL